MINVLHMLKCLFCDVSVELGCLSRKLEYCRVSVEQVELVCGKEFPRSTTVHSS